jgi:PKD repeat protein
MKLISGLLCGAALLVLSSGCGTARAIVDDRDDDAVVESIRPTSGVSGESVTFEAKCCTKSGIKPDYEWNFGGAADPNVSFDEKPSVSLRAGSGVAYNATLKLTGGCLGENLSVTTPFQINVAPLSVVAVTGGNGIAKGAGTFAVVIGTGKPTKYQWDFGGGASPSGAVGENPTVTFSSVPGTYQGRVIVSNDYESTEFLFDIVLT